MTEEKFNLTNLPICGKIGEEIERPYILEGGKRRYDVTKTSCRVCQNYFFIRRKNLSKLGNCCSEKCRAAVAERVEVACDNCGRNISKPPCRVKEKNFCNPKCLGEYRRKKCEQICKVCGKNYTARVKDYCSNKCYFLLRYNFCISSWLGGDNPKSLTHIRKFLFLQNKNSCSECGWSKINPVTGLVPLQIHHLDGDYTNNKFDNLQLLCPCCHAITPNYGALNLGKGRENRRKRHSGTAA